MLNAAQKLVLNAGAQYCLNFGAQCCRLKALQVFSHFSTRQLKAKRRNF
jgi:hypothetical protein